MTLGVANFLMSIYWCALTIVHDDIRLFFIVFIEEDETMTQSTKESIRQRFLLPEEAKVTELICELLKAIPDTWIENSSVTGWLGLSVKTEEEVAALGNGVLLHYNQTVTRVHLLTGWVVEPFRVIFYGKEPRSVGFCKAGYRGSPLPLKDVLSIIKVLICSGYKGAFSVSAHTPTCDGDKDDCVAALSVFGGFWSQYGENYGLLPCPPSIAISYHPQHEERSQDLESFIEVCSSFALEPLSNEKFRSIRI